MHVAYFLISFAIFEHMTPFVAFVQGIKLIHCFVRVLCMQNPINAQSASLRSFVAAESTAAEINAADGVIMRIVRKPKQLKMAHYTA